MCTKKGPKCRILRFQSRECALSGTNASLAKKKVAQLRAHGIFAGGSVDDDDDPCKMGGPTVKCVKHAACSSIPPDAVYERTISVAQSSTPSHPPARKFNAASGLELGFVELSKERAKGLKDVGCGSTSRLIHQSPLKRCNIVGLAHTAQSLNAL